MSPYIFPGLEKREVIYRINSCVAIDYGTTTTAILGTSRVANIKEARHVAAYLIYTCTDLSYEAVGDILGGKDHSTMIYSVRNIKKLCSIDIALRQYIKDTIKALNLTYHEMKINSLGI